MAELAEVDHLKGSGCIMDANGSRRPVDRGAASVGPRRSTSVAFSMHVTHRKRYHRCPEHLEGAACIVVADDHASCVTRRQKQLGIEDEQQGAEAGSPRTLTRRGDTAAMSASEEYQELQKETLMLGSPRGGISPPLLANRTPCTARHAQKRAYPNTSSPL